LRYQERELLEDVLKQYKEVEAGILGGAGRDDKKQAEKEEL
jgi:hypothetical protein